MDVGIPGKIWPARLLEPPVPCPNCQQPVNGFVSGESLYSGNSITRSESIEGVPASKLKSTIVYTLHPCYCQVDQYWMSAFSEEMGRREKGRPPRSVEGRSQANKEAMVEELQGRLRALYTKRDAAIVADIPSRKAAIEREICLLVTELARAIPGSHNKVAAIALEPEVLQWARQSKLNVPPGSGSNPERAVKLTLEQIHKHLQLDPEFNEKQTGRRLLVLAQAMFKELQDFVNKGKPVSQQTLRVAGKLVPGAEGFIVGREVEGPVIDDPETVFQDSFARRRRRRLDVRNDDDGKDVDDE